MTSNPEKVVYEKFYVHEIAAVDLSKIYFLKNAKKTCKPNNRDLNRDWKTKFINVFSNIEGGGVLIKRLFFIQLSKRKNIYRKPSICNIRPAYKEYKPI